MPRTRVPYTPEFRAQILELVRAGRTPNELAREFMPRMQCAAWTEFGVRLTPNSLYVLPRFTQYGGMICHKRDSLVRLRQCQTCP